MFKRLSKVFEFAAMRHERMTSLDNHARELQIQPMNSPHVAAWLG